MIQEKSIGRNNSFVPGSNPEFLCCATDVHVTQGFQLLGHCYHGHVWPIKELVTIANSVFTK